MGPESLIFASPLELESTAKRHILGIGHPLSAGFCNLYAALFGLNQQARENVRLAEQLRNAEARRFELGLSNLIDVNIREVQAADAAVALIRAQAAYFRAGAEYRAAVGVAF